PTRLGGGLQTHSLRFRAGDGREFAFRSVDKDQTQAIRHDLRGTVVSEVVQDQISSLVPAAGVAAHGVEAAAGLPHTTERLFMMPDDPRLGEFRRQFAGMLGTLEERPSVAARAAGADRLVETDSMLAALESGPGERLDDRGYLAVRLVDFLLGDWDRHGGQYEWMRFPRDGGHLWRVFPRDRDYAFSDYDGLLPNLAHGVIRNAVRYRGRIELLGLLLDAAPLDHRLLGGIDRAAWDSVTRSVQARIGDAEIDSAVAALPPEWRTREGVHLAEVLRARRDDLARVSGDFYRVVAREVEAHGTDRAEVAEVERLPGGNVRVTLSPADGGAPLYRRELSWVESREVRVYLHGGGDRARVFGSGPEQVIVRVIGGAGDDDLRDEGRSGHRTAFYDDAGSNRYTRRPRTRVDERAWKTVKWTPGGGKLPARDWGYAATAFAPSVGWHHAGTGPYVAVGPAWKRYGFRREPHAVEQEFRFMWLVQHGRFAAEYRGDFRPVGRPQDHTAVLARASEMEASRFFGFGNGSVAGSFQHDHFTVFERQLLGDLERWHGIGHGAWLVGGVTGRYSEAEPVAGAPSGDDHPRGAKDWLGAGARAGVVLDRADSTAYHRAGWTLRAFGSGFPLTAHDASAFGGARAVGTAYLSPFADGPTLALRGGGQRVWGGFPFQYAAYLGGSHTLRGHASERFAGDASAYGNAELRQVLARAKLVVHGELGAFGLADAGRVWYRGASPGGWHTAVGGGLFFTFLDRSRAVSAYYAKGEESTVNFSFGLPF
ncbi:MAG TPA: hypothetical protein VGO40_10465, partial [Longimicrobium sp.]|nr:hypothetical protein [Longimicrobium sp.]